MDGEHARCGLMTAWDCDVIPEALTVYSMNNSMSRLIGTGSLKDNCS